MPSPTPECIEDSPPVHPARHPGPSVTPYGNTAHRRLRRPISAYVAAACVVVSIGVALRFHDLGDPSLGGDEALAAWVARGSLEELVRKTQRFYTAPITSPLLLWLVQKIEISNFSVRLPSAAASSLTVAALLFLLPAAGVSRRVALLSGLLSALSMAALVEGHSARAYSLDALVAALLIVGLLRWVRDGGGRGLLAAGLLLGPLVRYGLVLFGLAVLATGLVMSGRGGRSSGAPVDGGLVRAPVGWAVARARAAAGLFLPATLFAVGCGISFVTTGARQMASRGLDLSSGGAVVGYLRDAYYGGDLTDIVGLARFAVSRAHELLDAHLAPPLAAVTLFGAGGLLLGFQLAGRQRRVRRRDGGAGAMRRVGVVGPLVLVAISFVVAVGAAAAGIYPLTTGRHGVYLGPAMYTAAGTLLATAIERPAASIPRWPTSALYAVVAVWIAFIGAREIRRETASMGVGTVEEVVGLLASEVRPEDLVYVVGQHPVASLNFYLPSWPENYHRTLKCGFDLACSDELVRLARSLPEPPGRIYLVTIEDEGPWIGESLRGWGEDIRLEPLVARKGVAWRQWGGDIRLYRMDNSITGETSRIRSAPLRDYGRPGREEPAIASYWEIWRREDALVYRRAPCSAADTETRFFLEFHASEAAAAEARLVENRDFDFEEYGIRRDGAECLAVVPIPVHGFEKFETGQIGPTTRWQATGRLDEERWRARLGSAVGSIRSGAWTATARSEFALFSAEEALWYYRAPCSREDIEARFFLHLYPRSATDLPVDRLEHGFENRDFAFPDRGRLLDGGCIARVHLPDYEIARLRTGQFRSGGAPLWSVELPLDAAPPDE